MRARPPLKSQRCEKKVSKSKQNIHFLGMTAGREGIRGRKGEGKRERWEGQRGRDGGRRTDRQTNRRSWERQRLAQRREAGQGEGGREEESKTVALVER